MRPTQAWQGVAKNEGVTPGAGAGVVDDEGVADMANAARNQDVPGTGSRRDRTGRGGDLPAEEDEDLERKREEKKEKIWGQARFI